MNCFDQPEACSKNSKFQTLCLYSGPIPTGCRSLFKMAWFVLILQATLIASAAGDGRSQIQVLKEHLNTTNYDRATHPYYGVNSTKIRIDVYVETFGKVEEVNMELSAYMYFRQEWKDPRLANVINLTVTLTREDISEIWRPDTYCYNSRQTDLNKEDKNLHSLLRVYPNGDVLYSRNTHIVAACDMDLRNFPIDVQNCSITFGSYGFRTSEVDYQWKRNKVVVAQPTLAQFSIMSSKVSRRVSKFTTGNYTIVEVSFLLQRRLGFYMIQLYLPCLFLVMLSWIVFWMSPENGGDRLTVGITCILTIVFLLGYVNGMLPKVSYVKGVDWYLMASFLFIFLSLAECVLVGRLGSSEVKESKDEGRENEGMDASSEVTLSKLETNLRRSSQSTNVSPDSPVRHNGRAKVLPVTMDKAPAEKPPIRMESSGRKICFEPLRGKISSKLTCVPNLSRAEKIDFACRILFPLSYALYNTSYWYVYLHGVEILA